MDERWTIDELVGVVRRALEAARYAGQPTARVREVPDLRTIRYYTTLGLVDRPTAFRGRTAYYARRHALQLIAIKRLQSQGRTLVEVQQTLLGVDDATLARSAELPDGFWEQADHPEPAAPSPDGAFWRQVPELSAVEDSPSAGRALPPDLAVRTLVEIELAAGVRLLLEGVRPEEVSSEGLAELASRAAELVAYVKRRGWA